MMSLSSNDLCKEGLGKISISDSIAVQAQGNKDTGDDGSSTSSCITKLSDDCLSCILKRLPRDDRDSFGLTCRRWLLIQSSNRESLWYHESLWNNYIGRSHHILPEFSPECFLKVLCKLLSRFQNLKDIVSLQPQLSGSNIQRLSLDHCSNYSDTELSLMFSWLPRLTAVGLICSSITDKGLEALAKYCSSLQRADLSGCCSITDSGIILLLKNCRKLQSLSIRSCNGITGIGFLGCAGNLTHVDAGGCKLTPEGIEAIVSGGRLEYLILSAAPNGLAKVGEGSINTEAVIKISKGCPLLKELRLVNCEEVELEGWESIGLNCKNLKRLNVCG